MEGGVVTRESLRDSLRQRGYRDDDYVIRSLEDEDFSHLPPWDRPPPFVAEAIRCARGIEHDRSETRPPLDRLPSVGLIEDLRGAQSGRVVVLGNGLSVGAFDLNRLRVPIVGCNRTFRGFPGYEGPEVDWLCVIDPPWLQRPEVWNHPGLINMTSDGAQRGIRVAKSYRMDPWSFDLARDGVVPVDTGYCAMQLATYLGFEELFLMGFEGTGPHFDGTASGDGMQNQSEFLMRVSKETRGFRALTVGFSCPAFPRVEFETLTED